MTDSFKKAMDFCSGRIREEIDRPLLELRRMDARDREAGLRNGVGVGG